MQKETLLPPFKTPRLVTVDTHVGEEKDMDGLSDAGDVGNSVPVPLRFFIAIAFDAA